MPVPEVAAGRLRGVVLFIDRFGNLVTNIDRIALDRFAQGRSVEIATTGLASARLVETYADIDGDRVCGLFGSTNRLELAARSASAADRLAIGAGAVVEVSYVR